MSTSEDRILKSIIRDMSEGVIVLGLDGEILQLFLESHAWETIQ